MTRLYRLDYVGLKLRWLNAKAFSPTGQSVHSILSERGLVVIEYIVCSEGRWPSGVQDLWLSVKEQGKVWSCNIYVRSL